MSNTQIADLQGKTDRAVRYMKDTVFRKIRKKVYEYLTSEMGKTHDVTLAEKRFVENYKTEYFEKRWKQKYENYNEQKYIGLFDLLIFR